MHIPTKIKLTYEKKNLPFSLDDEDELLVNFNPIATINVGN